MLALVLVLGVSLSHAVEVKYSSLSWIDYSASFDNAFAMDDSSGAFAIGRLYNTFKVSLSDNFKGRVTLDFAKAANPWKYAYVDWKIAGPLVLTFGLQKTYFGYTPIWEYPLPVKALADRVKASSSADFGIGIGGKLAGGKIMYNLQLLNGEGYDKTVVLPASYALGANVVINPMEMLSIGLSFRLAEKTQLVPVPNFVDNALAAYVDLTVNKLWFLAEYVGSLPEGGSLESDIQITAGYMLSKMSGIYVNFFNKYATSTNSTQAITIGANLSPVKGFALKPYAELALDGGLNEIVLGFQTEITFGFTYSDQKKEEATTTTPQ